MRECLIIHGRKEETGGIECIHRVSKASLWEVMPRDANRSDIYERGPYIDTPK